MKQLFRFELTVEDSTMVVPRMLQVLSRRGFVLRSLSTDQLDDGILKLQCTVEGAAQWEKTLPGLLHKLVEVHSIRLMNGSEDE